MKFVRFDAGKTGLVVENAKVLDVAKSLKAFERSDGPAAKLLARLLPGDGSGSWTGLIENWAEARPALNSLLALARDSKSGVTLTPLDTVSLEPPLPSAQGTIVAIGGNNAVHMSRGMSVLTGKTVSPETFAKEKAEGHPPWGFIILPVTLAGPYDEVGPPKDVRLFDYEAEVAIVLAAGGRDISPEQMKVWGYAAWNDLSIRDARFGLGPAMNRGGLSWGLEKNFEKANVFGPWLVVDEPANLEDLHCTLRVNGQVRQDFRTSEFIWNFADAVTHISHYIRLRPGDVIVSGTGPGVAAETGLDGENWLRPGDVIEYELEGVGVLRNKVRDWTR